MTELVANEVNKHICSFICKLIIFIAFDMQHVGSFLKILIYSW